MQKQNQAVAVVFKDHIAYMLFPQFMCVQFELDEPNATVIVGPNYTLHNKDEIMCIVTQAHSVEGLRETVLTALHSFYLKVLDEPAASANIMLHKDEALPMQQVQQLSQYVTVF